MGQPIAIDLVKPLMRTTIAAHSYFSGEVVLDDNGDAFEQEEAALNNPSFGQCTTILPILDGDLVGAATHGAAILRLGLAVRYAINPAKRQKDLLKMMRLGTAALLGYSIADRRDAFNVSEKAFVIDDRDPGCLAYTRFYSKLAIERYTDT